MNNGRFIGAALLSCVFVITTTAYQYSVAEFVDVHGNLRQFINVSPAVVRARTRAGNPVSKEFNHFVYNDPMMQEAVKARKIGSNRVSLSAAALQTNVGNDLRQEGSILQQQADSYAGKAHAAKCAAGLGGVIGVGGLIMLIGAARGEGKAIGASLFLGGTLVGGSGLVWIWSNAEAQDNIKEALVQNAEQTKTWQELFTVVDDRNVPGK